ncbi:torsin-1A-interacting protein 2 isoform X2 [Fundulus heteroclitus]|uniref:torsin-1A-interacting protein 2 isoform X2 n=1 Tax=Fundulus heteroclitus TaxID=8078 RepID=UPI00165A30F6|nr:torsin-1A-interacting protein 2 isoform X2 [Fundulus heteroclitus]
MEETAKHGCEQPDAPAQTTVQLLGEDLTGNETEQKPATSQTPGSKEEFAVAKVKAGLNEETPATEATDSDAGEAFKEQAQKASPQEQSNEQRQDVESFGRSPKEAANANVSEYTENREDLKQLGCEKKPGDCGSDGDQRASGDAKSEKVGLSLTTNMKIVHQADDEQRDDSKGDTSEHVKPVATTPDGHPSQSVTSDADLDIQNKNPGQPANEANNAAPDDHFSPSVLRASEMMEEEHRKEEIEKQNKTMSRDDVETIGPATTQAEPSDETAVFGGGRIWVAVAVAVAALAVAVAILWPNLFQSKAPPPTADLRQVDVFLKQMEKVKTRFPSQRAELWSRSEIHLKRHLLTSQPTEPVSLILTSGLRAERTMRCLAQDVASAFSAARNASVLHIDGASKAGQDSDQVKLDIDRKLVGAFEGDKPVAVIHRLEELPPGATLIFYRYCDHENAAYKKTFLIFTVLLGDEEEIPAEMRLSVVEEMVDDHLQKRFLSHGHPVSFDRMDLNKYGGLWSRISHLILPVAAEERIEREGC